MVAAVQLRRDTVVTCFVRFVEQKPPLINYCALHVPHASSTSEKATQTCKKKLEVRRIVVADSQNVGMEHDTLMLD